jgi:ABC-type oligopeptide transport system substrate-binding subunit
MELDQMAYTDYQQKYKVADSPSFRNFDGMIGNRPASFADPSGYFTTYWNPSSTRSMQKWTDDTLEQMFADQDQELDREARIEKLHEIQRYMHGDDVLNAVTIHTEASTTLWQPYVRNMFPRLNYGRGSEMIAQIWFDKA